MNLIKTIFFVVSFSLNNINCFSQIICRGPGLNEIYFSGQTGYYERTLFRSTDNGKTVSVMSTYDFRADSSAICRLGFPLADVTDGIVYCLDRVYIEPLCISYDYGTNWMKSNSYPNSSFSISGGVEPGKIFIVTTGDDPSIYHSDDFGQTFQKVNQAYSFSSIETGTEPNEIWVTYEDTSSFYLLFSNTNGSTFDTIPIPDSIIGNGYWFQQFSRGTQPGELYLETITFDAFPAVDSIKLFRTVNYAQSFDLIYEEAGDGNDIFNFTAGRLPCSLYLIRSKIVSDSIIYLIEYSDDCGAAFITTGTGELRPQKDPSLQANPNPFYNTTTIEFEIRETGMAEICVRSVLGKHQKTIFSQNVIPGSYSHSFDLSYLSSGIYLIEFKLNGNSESIGKLVKQ
jgi:hypothetical protein